MLPCAIINMIDIYAQDCLDTYKQPPTINSFIRDTALTFFTQGPLTGEELNGLEVPMQVAKNIVLAGVGSLHLLDDTPSSSGCATNFLNQTEEASIRSVHSLQPEARRTISCC